MTFKKLQKRIGPQCREDWHQHVNGRGWVFKSATVDETAYVGPDSIVWGLLSDNARVSGHARVEGGAEIFGNVRISGDALVRGRIKLSGQVQAFGNDKIVVVR